MQAQYETQLRYRALDANGDMIFGATYGGVLEKAEAMAQVLKTRLHAIEGEWWEGDETAIPWMTEVLGQVIGEDMLEEIDLMVIDRIMDTVGVIGIDDIDSGVENRHYYFRCTVSTVYGDIDMEVTK